MKNILTIILLILIYPTINLAQKTKFEVSYGIGTYSMNDLKSLNNFRLEKLPVKGKITDDFPPQPFESIKLTTQIHNRFVAGLTGSHNTTGSRVNYKDYSGEYKCDQLLTSYAPGIVIGMKLYDAIIDVSINANATYSFTKLKIEETLMTETTKNSFTANSLSILPEIKIAYSVKQFELSINTGYLYDFGADFLTSNGTEIIKTSNSKQKISSNWSGYRFSLNLGYCFN